MRDYVDVGHVSNVWPGATTLATNYRVIKTLWPKKSVWQATKEEDKSSANTCIHDWNCSNDTFEWSAKDTIRMWKVTVTIVTMSIQKKGGVQRRRRRRSWRGGRESTEKYIIETEWRTEEKRKKSFVMQMEKVRIRFYTKRYVELRKKGRSKVEKQKGCCCCG